jgi:hypothetical protein
MLHCEVFQVDSVMSLEHSLCWLLLAFNLAIRVTLFISLKQFFKGYYELIALSVGLYSAYPKSYTVINDRQLYRYNYWGRYYCYLPIQKDENISLNKSSLVNSPVILLSSC